MTLTRSTLLAVLLPMSACYSGAQIRATGDVIKADIEKARRSGAVRCAPQELAEAEANLEFALGELDQGNSQRAHEHIEEAEAKAKRAVLRSRECGPKQVLVREDTTKVVRIEEADRDGDGVLDASDQCPSLAGPADNKGCPREAPKDRDGDGLLDANDRCPDQPEDVDGFQDDDGCPEADNDNDGVTDIADKCPVEPGPVATFGCPVTDKDEDGVSDQKDACPNEPEDKDGYKDDDGCPDLDNDDDGVPDQKDQCRDVAEDKDGFEDADGCPEKDNDSDGVEDAKDDCPTDAGPVENRGCPKSYTLVSVTRERIELKRPIRFGTGSAKLLAGETQLVLKDVAQAINDNAQIKKVRIEGHTDSVGNDDRNLKLSQARADTVRLALIRLKVDPARLESVGFGESKPIASNTTASGRSENRRTEFNITEQ